MARLADADLILSDTSNLASPLTLSGTQYTRSVKCGAGTHVSLFLQQVGTATTAITLWSTNKPERERNDAVDTDWNQETGIAVPNQPVGATINSMLQLADVSCVELRYKLVTSGGAGVAKCWSMVKE